MVKPRPVDMPTTCDHIGFYWGKERGDCYIVGMGTSLRAFDYGLLRDKKTIGLNNAMLMFRPTWHLFPDNNLFKRYIKCD